MRNLHGTERLTKNKNFDPLRENRAFRRKAKKGRQLQECIGAPPFSRL